MDTFLFDLASDLTGGLITDLKTALAGMLLLAFILMGLDLLKSALETKIKKYFLGQALSDAEAWYERRQSSSGMYRDFADVRYRQSLSKAARLSDRLHDRFF